MDELFTQERGRAVLDNPTLNKGTAFSQEERDALGLNGFLPPHISTIDEQIARRYELFLSQPTPLSKHLFLANLQNSNETLYYLFVERYLTEMLPFIYTPTVGEACQQFSKVYQRNRGLYLSYPLKEKMEEILRNIPQNEVQVIVVTDGERILGLGDLGMGGIAISIGKLALYTLLGGIHPSKTLPIVLDVGTNNEELLNDPTYLGWKHKRLIGPEYDAFIDRFVQALKKRYPKVLLQWEDFGKANASRLLEKYQNTITSFNDDIQGTAAVTLSAIFTAIRLRKSSLIQQRFAILGGGSAGIGICKKIRFALLSEGISEEELDHYFYVVDIQGLIQEGQSNLDPGQKRFLQKKKHLQNWKVKDPSHITLLEVVQNAKPTVLIGVSAQGGAFTEEVVREMAKNHDFPAIFPLSNPNSRCEALPEDIFRWTDGKAIIATGSPFPAVSYKGESFPIAQCNNAYIFPGVGLGIIASQTPKVTDALFLIAAKTLSDHAPILTDPKGSLFPSFTDLRKISRKIAIEVYKTAINEGLCPKCPDTAIEKKVDQLIWKPHYPRLRPKP